MAFPFLVLVFLFSYLPLYGWIYAFYDYRPGIPLSKTEFVGLRWFTAMVSNPIQIQEILRVLRNTFAISATWHSYFGSAGHLRDFPDGNKERTF